jgi:hypothetical protein
VRSLCDQMCRSACLVVSAIEGQSTLVDEFTSVNCLGQSHTDRRRLASFDRAPMPFACVRLNFRSQRSPLAGPRVRWLGDPFADLGL